MPLYNQNYGLNGLPTAASTRPLQTPMTPDNGITFLDNGSFVKNPVNCKTPPPPLWGAVLEEDLYDNT